MTLLKCGNVGVMDLENEILDFGVSSNFEGDVLGKLEWRSVTGPSVDYLGTFGAGGGTFEIGLAGG